MGLFFAFCIVAIVLFCGYLYIEAQYDKRITAFLTEEEKAQMKDSVVFPSQTLSHGGAFIASVICMILTPPDTSLLGTIFSLLIHGIGGYIAGLLAIVISHPIMHWIGRHLFCRGSEKPTGVFPIHTVYAIVVIVVAIATIKTWG